jgi:hypothetical protein
MKKLNNKKLKTGQDSLEDVIKKIKPFMPKPQKLADKKEGHWKLQREGELPPIYSLKPTNIP